MLEALAAQTEKRWRLVMIDSGSRPEEQPIESELPHGARLIHERNLGFAEANYVAARGAETPYLVCLNPDALPAPDWLAVLIAVAERYPQAGAIGSTQLRTDDESVFDGTGDVLH